MTQIVIKTDTAPSTPATGKVSLYAKTDKKLYFKDDAGLETAILQPSGAAWTLLGSTSHTSPDVSSVGLALNTGGNVVATGDVYMAVFDKVLLVAASGAYLGPIFAGSTSNYYWETIGEGLSTGSGISNVVYLAQLSPLSAMASITRLVIKLRVASNGGYYYWKSAQVPSNTFQASLPFVGARLYEGFGTHGLGNASGSTAQPTYIYLYCNTGVAGIKSAASVKLYKSTDPDKVEEV